MLHLATPIKGWIDMMSTDFKVYVMRPEKAKKSPSPNRPRTTAPSAPGQTAADEPASVDIKALRGSLKKNGAPEQEAATTKDKDKELEAKEQDRLKKGEAREKEIADMLAQKDVDAVAAKARKEAKEQAELEKQEARARKHEDELRKKNDDAVAAAAKKLREFKAKELAELNEKELLAKDIDAKENRTVVKQVQGTMWGLPSKNKKRRKRRRKKKAEAAEPKKTSPTTSGSECKAPEVPTAAPGSPITQVRDEINEQISG